MHIRKTNNAVCSLLDSTYGRNTSASFFSLSLSLFHAQHGNIRAQTRNPFLFLFTTGLEREREKDAYMRGEHDVYTHTHTHRERERERKRETLFEFHGTYQEECLLDGDWRSHLSLLPLCRSSFSHTAGVLLLVQSPSFTHTHTHTRTPLPELTLLSFQSTRTHTHVTSFHVDQVWCVHPHHSLSLFQHASPLSLSPEPNALLLLLSSRLMGAARVSRCAQNPATRGGSDKPSFFRVFQHGFKSQQLLVEGKEKEEEEKEWRKEEEEELRFLRWF